MNICVIAMITASFVLQDSQIQIGEFSLGACLTGMLATHLLIVVSAHFTARQTIRDAGTPSLSKRKLDQRFETRLRFQRVIWLVGVLFSLVSFQWPHACSRWAAPGLGTRLLVLLPALCSLITSWAILFSAEATIDSSWRRQGRLSFILRQIRFSLLLPLLMILLVVLWQDYFQRLPASWQHPPFSVFYRSIPLVAIAVGFPILLRFTWRTHSLAAGSLRTRLDGLARRHKFHYRDILVWNTDMRHRNAAVSGLLPTCRYVLLSDQLIRDLSEQDIEGIFLHEIAHARERHPLRMMAFALGIAALVTVGLLTTHGPISRGLCITISLAGALGLSRLSRSFELQADLWAAQTVGNYPMRYLRAIASVSTGSPDQATWTHPSFQRRCEFLMMGENKACRTVRQDQRNAWLALVCVVTLPAVLLLRL